VIEGGALTDGLMPTVTATEVVRRGQQSLAAQISTRMVKLLASYTGRGPTKARTTIDANVIVVVTDDTLTTAERNLAAAGEVEAVRSMRNRFHHLIYDEAVAMIEMMSGRNVRAFMCDVEPAANLAAHVFVLEPQPGRDE
jgi:uncharacterized protein YbcI